VERLEFKKEQIKEVNIDEVRPNTWNPKDKDTEDYRKVKRGIQLKGQRLPIIVRENNGYEIIDGEQRWTACKELGYKKVIIYNEGQLSDKDAKELTIWYQMQVPFNEIELANLVKDLSQYEDLEIPYNEEEIKEMCELSGFSWEDYNKDKEIKEENKEELRTIIVTVTESQYEIIAKALAHVKEQNDLQMLDGKALELICGDYLAGV
jgi:hypothetical protein